MKTGSNLASQPQEGTAEASGVPRSPHPGPRLPHAAPPRPVGCEPGVSPLPPRPCKQICPKGMFS